MELRHYAAVVSRRWVSGLLAVLLVVGATALWMAFTPSSYRSSAVLLATGRGGASANPYNDMLVAQQRVKLYADLATIRQVAAGVAEDLGLPLTAEQMQHKLHATANTDTALLTISASDSSATRARDIAAAAASELTRLAILVDGPADARGRAVRLTIVQPAQLPTDKSPARTGGLVLGGLLAIVFAAIAMALREASDSRVHGPDDLIDAFDIDVAATVPTDRSLAGSPTISLPDGGSPRAESLRMLRARLQVLRGDGTATVTVAGTAPGDGASTVAATLAMSLARSGARVVVVDADLRRPRLDTALGVRGVAGLADVLSGRRRLEKVLVEAPGSGIHVVPAGLAVGRIGDLVDRDGLAAVVTELQTYFDFVVFDAPPALVAADASVIGAVTDGVVLVVRQGVTRYADVDRAIRGFRTSGAVLLGAVLNHASPARRHRGYAVEAPESEAVTASVGHRGGSRA